jgi:uncharacterized membrane protein
MTSWLLAFHLLGIALWIGGLLAACVTLAQSAAADSAARNAVAQSARKLMRLLADPGAALAILAGGWLLAADFSGYCSLRWFQTKLVVVLGLLALHGAIAVRAKRAAGAESMSAALAWRLFLGVLLAAAAIVLLSLPGRLLW